jgi:hypothetical protein
MWLYTHYTMALRDHQSVEISGEHRAIPELAAAMRAELQIENADISVLKEKQLKERIDKEFRGGAVFHAYTDSGHELFSFRKRLETWFETNKWWLLAMLGTTIICSTGWMFLRLVFWLLLWLVLFGQFLALCIGTTVGSRLLVVLFWCVIAIIIGTVVT